MALFLPYFCVHLYICDKISKVFLCVTNKSLYMETDLKLSSWYSSDFENSVIRPVFHREKEIDAKSFNICRQMVSCSFMLPMLYLLLFDICALFNKICNSNVTNENTNENTNTSQYLTQIEANWFQTWELSKR